MLKVTKIKFWKYFIAAVFIILVANANTITNNDRFILIFTILLGTIFYYKKLTIDVILIKVIFVFIIINFISYYFVNQTSFNYVTFTGFIIKIIFPYFIVKIIGKDFFKIIEKIIYVLTLISIPIFIVQYIYPRIFYSLSSILNFLTLDEQKYNGGWYIVVYMFSGWFPERNAGFMWEPGAFAFMILLGMTITFSKYKKIIFTNRILIYLFALILTFSTMGYLALLIILLVYLIRARKLWLVFILLPFIYPLTLQLIHVDFLLPKINDYFSSINRMTVNQNYNYLKGNRFTYFLFALSQVSHWPFGYGVVPSKFMLNSYYSNVNGVGTLSKILIYWGVEGILFFIYSLKRFYSVLLGNSDKLLIITFSFVMIIAFFSNPLEKSPILFAMIFYPYIYKKSYE